MAKKISFYIVLNLVNSFLKGHHFFRLKNIFLKFIGLDIGENSKIVGPINISYVNKVVIGKNTWIGKNFTIDGNGSVVIGDNCDIAPNLIINTGGHEIGDVERRAGKGLVNHTTINNGTWIGTNVVIVNGAEIAQSAVVAAGSVVINNVKKNTLVAGVPAVTKRILS
ncbi:acyltransferase [Planococcus sp. CAU13]|uniref:acyltransferase n=1 Tax=Planococcus sp. CAU13 TaxID=1541197 RepID=UPI00052FE28B|nr:acyltransferase [Planococcus sp. CAU13]